MRSLFTVLLIFLSFNLSYAQDEDNEYSEEEVEEEFEGLKEDKKKIDLSRFLIGGDLGIGFSTNTFFAEISPLIGYQIFRDRLEVGLGPVYQHQSQIGNYAMNNFGAQTYIRAYIFSGLYAQIDGFVVSYNVQSLTGSRVEQYTYGNGFIGGGYAFNHDTSPVILSISVKTNILVDQVYPYHLVIPKMTVQFKL